jgi:hypothetical protein
MYSRFWVSVVWGAETHVCERQQPLVLKTSQHARPATTIFFKRQMSCTYRWTALGGRAGIVAKAKLFPRAEIVIDNENLSGKCDTAQNCEK